MKLYYATSKKSDKDILMFEGEPLYASTEKVLHFLIQTYVKKVLVGGREMTENDYVIREYKPEPRTNADRVRQMSDEELGFLFNYIADKRAGAFTHEVCVRCMDLHNGECPKPGDDNECDPETNPYGLDDMMNWLKMEVKVEVMK